MSPNITTGGIIDRCLAAASSCVEMGNDRRANERMKAEFRELAKEVSHWQLTGDIKADLFLLPMEEELLSRHGDLIGRRLYWDFVDAFWIQTWTEIPLDFSQMERAVGPMMDLFERLQSDRALRRMIHGRDYSTFYSNN